RGTFRRFPGHGKQGSLVPGRVVGERRHRSHRGKHMLKFDVVDSARDASGRSRPRWRRRVLPMLAFVAVLAGVLAPTTAASAAGGASVTISSGATSVTAGSNVTLTLSLTCSVTGGCAGTTLTFPVNTYTDLT